MRGIYFEAKLLKGYTAEMEFLIREYDEKDRAELVRCLEEFQEYLVKVDTWKLTKKDIGFGEVYADWLLGYLPEIEGVLYLAEGDGKIVGLVAGGVRGLEAQERAGETVKSGRVHELYVDCDYRGQGIGKALMNKMEDYLRSKKCEVLYVEVFAPNKNAHEFYHACGYADHDINLMKKLSA